MPTTIRTPTGTRQRLLTTAWTPSTGTLQSAVQNDDSATAQSAHLLPVSSTHTVWINFGFFAAAKGSTLDSGPALLDPATLSPGGVFAVLAATRATVQARKTDAGGDEAFGMTLLDTDVELGARPNDALTTADADYTLDVTNMLDRAIFGDGRVEGSLNSLRIAGLVSYTTHADYLHVRVIWAIRYDRKGGGSSAANGGGVRTQLVSRKGGGSSQASGGGRISTLVNRAGGGSSAAVGGGAQHTLVNRAGGGTSQADGGGVRTVLVARPGGGVVTPVPGGIERLYTFAISDLTVSGSGAVIAAARVDCFRTDTKAFLATTTSDGSGAFRIQLTSQPITYFLRSFKAGSPNVFGTTDEDLVVEEELVQGPPP